MARRLRTFFVTAAALACGCGEPVEPAAPLFEPAPSSAGPAVPIPTGSAEAQAPLPFATPVLAPLARDARPPCEIAKDTRKAADLALGKGRSYKALRLVEKADKQCPTTAQASWGTRLDALQKLGRDDAAKDLAKAILAAPPGDGSFVASAKAVVAKAPGAAPPAADTLLASALAAQQSGASDARAQLDRALARLEIETSKTPEPFLDAGERRALSLSGDGTTAAIASGNTVVLLDAKTLHPLRFFDGASSPAGASLSADGKLLAILQRDAVEVWSTATDKRVQRLVWAGEEPHEALFTPDGKRLIVGAERTFDAVIRVWNLETGDSADSFNLPREGAVSCMALSRDGKLLAIGTDRGTLQLWAVSPHKQVASLAKKESYLESLLSLAFSPKGDKLLTFARTGKMTVWDTKTTKSLWEVDAEASFGHGAATFSSDGTRVRGSTEAGFHTAIREWDAATGAELQNKPAGVGPSFFSQDGRFGFGGDRDLLGVVDTVSGTEKTVSNAAPRLGAMLFGPPRTLVLTFDGDKAFRVVTPEGTRYFPVEDTYGSVALSLDGRTLAHSSYREFYVWDVDKGAPIKSYPAPPDRATDVTFGPVGGEMRVWSRDFDVLSMSVAAPGAPAWKELFRMERKDLRGLRPSGYGRYAAIASDKKVFVLDASNGALHSAQEDTTLRLDRFAVSADGTALFLSREKRIDRFDMASGKALGTTSVPGCTLSTLASSFDGSRVLAQCWEHSYLFSYAPGSDPPTTTNVDLGRTAYDKTALAPHGDLIVTGQDDGSLRVRDTGAALRMEIFPLPGADAMLFRSPAGRVRLSGKDAAKIEERLFCRVGPRAVPFVVCEDALTDDDLLADAFAPASP